MRFRNSLGMKPDLLRMAGRCLLRRWGKGKRMTGYAARFLHLAISAEPAPMVNSERMRRSRETEWSPASILATRDWLDPN